MFCGRRWSNTSGRASSATAKSLTFDKSTYVHCIASGPWLIPLQVLTGKILDNEIPVFVIQFSTQEILLFRNAKTREIEVGAEDRVEQCTYISAVTRLEEELGNELTGGWKVIEVCLSNRTLIRCKPLTYRSFRWRGEVRGRIYRLEAVCVSLH
jgi:hypothetical protein